jgi:hypothetical protein
MISLFLLIGYFYDKKIVNILKPVNFEKIVFRISSFIVHVKLHYHNTLDLNENIEISDSKNLVISSSKLIRH